MIDEKEWSEFKIECSVYKTKIDKLEKVTETQEERIAILERNNTKTDLQYEQIMKTLTKLVEQTIPELSKEIQTIKNKPAERYNTIVVAVIGAIAGGIGTYLLNLILQK